MIVYFKFYLWLWFGFNFDFNSFHVAVQSSNVENLSPQIIRQVAKEMQDIHTNAPEGIKVQINESDVTDIQAVLEGPGL